MTAPRLVRALLSCLAFAAATGSGFAHDTPDHDDAPDDRSLAVPAPGAHYLRILSPDILEITAIVEGSTVVPGDKTPTPPPEPPVLAGGDFEVRLGDKPLPVAATGFRRRAVYAPLKQRDLRIGNFVYLRLSTPVPEGAEVAVRYKGNVPWLSALHLTAHAAPRRHSPAIHTNQVGYLPHEPKSAFVGYYLGTLGELPVPEHTAFTLIDSRSRETVFRGELSTRPDLGAPFPWYQRVLEADFGKFDQPGEYELVVAGLGASYPFRIDDGTAAAFARTYALGLYHQRCGGANELPYTRFVHGVCHTAPAQVPTGPVHALIDFPKEPADVDLYPFVHQGRIDVSGGHHDAGDYSKYTINSAHLIHQLVFAVDAFPGVAALDNLGLPESGDGHGDVLQEAKWEADFLAKMQDDDGGFYFLVYPEKRLYEDNVLPDHGDPQIVWPKNTAATGAAVAALAECASSPAFKKQFPEAARHYLEVAQRGWRFLMAAENRYGRGNTYRKFTHYGDLFKDADEIAWAATALFVATGEEGYHKEIRSRLDPRNPAERRWGWWRMVEGYGAAVRDYAFAARTGRLDHARLDPRLLARCEDEIIACADDWLHAARDSAYGTSYPEPTKRVLGGGWYFPFDRAFDLAVASQLDFPVRADKRPAYRAAILSNLNYEAGANPVDVCFLTGLGWKRPHEIVDQYAQNDRRVLPPSGIPLGSIQDGFGWMANYKGELGALCYPLDGAKDAPYPILDRWGDSFNLETEFISVNQARALAVTAWLMAQGPIATQAWKAQPAVIAELPATTQPHHAFTVHLQLAAGAPADLKLADARIVWEGRDQTPAFGESFIFTPRNSGAQWIEAEAQWPDGRRVFAAAEFNVAEH